MFAIAGVSGRTGSVVADTLLAQGQAVRVVVRDAAKGEPWRARGAGVAVASLFDAAALGRALEGADGAYLLSPEDPTSADPISESWRIAHAIAGALERSRVRHVVFLSTMGAQHAEGTGLPRRLHAAEERLRASPARLTFVRAAYLLDNWAAVLGAARGGALPTFLPPDRAVAMVATRDVGRFAAQALVEGPPAENELIDLAGPRDPSPRELAALLATRLGRPVEVDALPPHAAIPVFTAMGASPAFAEQIRLMFEAIHEGRVGVPGDGARLVRGTTAAEALFPAWLGAP
jgi:uncharacterized protein YbjT (DUF2867 family)